MRWGLSPYSQPHTIDEIASTLSMDAEEVTAILRLGVRFATGSRRPPGLP